MRYMVFNLLVAGALAFLLFDGGPPPTVRNAVDTVATKTGRLVEKGRELVGRAGSESPAREAPLADDPTDDPIAQGVALKGAVDRSTETARTGQPAPTPKPAVRPKPLDPPRSVAAAPRPAGSAPAVATPGRPLDPAVAQRRAEVLGTASPTAAPAPATASDFMAPRVRRSELHKLAEDMELMFVEKVAR